MATTDQSSVTIQGVPESITRTAYMALLRSIGLEPNDLFDLRFGHDGIYATVRARNANGNSYSDPLEANTIAKHRIVIPVIDA